jgi:hypothetical protein
MNQLLPIDKLTFWIFAGFWPIYLVWELILLVLRGHNPSVDLISMVARDRAYQMNCLAFTWCGLAAHFWINWKHLPQWDGLLPNIVFWLLVVGAVALDILLWKHPYSGLPFWLRVFRFPGTQVLLGLLAGAFLFPQRQAPGVPF